MTSTPYLTDTCGCGASTKVPINSFDMGGLIQWINAWRLTHTHPGRADQELSHEPAQQSVHADEMAPGGYDYSGGCTGTTDDPVGTVHEPIIVNEYASDTEIAEHFDSGAQVRTAGFGGW